MKLGKVYFIEAPGRIKIGYTRQPEKRLRSLQNGDMESLKPIAVIDGSRFLEKALHGVAAPYHLRGEWFRDCSEVRQIISDALTGKFPNKAEMTTTEAPDANINVRFEHPELMPKIRRLSEQLNLLMLSGGDKYEIRAQTRALIAITEVMLGRQLGGRDRTGGHGGVVGPSVGKDP